MAKANQSAAAAKAAAEEAKNAAGTVDQDGDTAEKLDPKTAITVLKPFAASENGGTVNEYPAGLYASLPPVATKHAIAIDAVSKEDAAKLLKALNDEAKQEAAE